MSSTLLFPPTSLIHATDTIVGSDTFRSPFPAPKTHSEQLERVTTRFVCNLRKCFMLLGFAMCTALGFTAALFENVFVGTQTRERYSYRTICPESLQRGSEMGAAPLLYQQSCQSLIRFHAYRAYPTW